MSFVLKKTCFEIIFKKFVVNTYLFQPVTPSLFRINSKLESVDKKNNNLVCVSTVVDTMGDRVLIHFDGWEDTYDYWCDITSPNILPVGWCEEQGLPLNPPCGKVYLYG